VFFLCLLIVLDNNVIYFIINKFLYNLANTVPPSLHLTGLREVTLPYNFIQAQPKGDYSLKTLFNVMRTANSNLPLFPTTASSSNQFYLNATFEKNMPRKTNTGQEVRMVRTRGAGRKRRLAPSDPSTPEQTVTKEKQPRQTTDTDQVQDGGERENAAAGQQNHGEQFPNIDFRNMDNHMHSHSQLPFSHVTSTNPLVMGSSQETRDSGVNLIADNLGLTTPQHIKDRIWRSEYIDLAILQKGAAHNEDTPVPWGINANGAIQALRRPTSIINTVAEWTDAFLIYSSIYLEKHGNKAQQLLKYISTIRTAANRFGGGGWKAYDRQFRLRMEKFPNTDWSTINTELWLMLLMPSNNRLPQPTHTYTNKPANKLPCYDYNDATCRRTSCRFAHICMNCSKPHPAQSCTKPNNEIAQGDRRQGHYRK